MSKIILFLLFFILSLSTVSATVQDYLVEFNNSGETCSFVDSFYYSEYHNGIINYYKDTVPVIIQCCSSEESCYSIFFDYKNKDLFSETSAAEIVDLNYVRFMFANGNLTKSYFISDGLNSCFLHDEDTLRQETANFLTDTAEEVALLKKTKQTKQVVSVIRTARTLEILSPFSLVDFGLSYACHYESKKLSKAVETLGDSNQLLGDISNGFTKSGSINSLENSFISARFELKDFYNDGVSKVKCGADDVLNFFGELGNWISGEKNLLKDDEWSQGKSECALAKELALEIEHKEALVHHPQRSAIVGNYVSHARQKMREYQSERLLTVAQLERLDNITPSWLTILITDLFNNPNYELSKEKEKEKQLQSQLHACDDFYNNLMFNSAINCVEKMRVEIEPLIQTVQEKTVIEKKTDWVALTILAVVVFLIVLGSIFLKNKYEEGYFL